MFPTEGSHLMNNNHYPQLCYGNQFQFPLPPCMLYHHYPYGYGPSFPCNGGGIQFPPQVGCHGCCSNGYLPPYTNSYCSFRPPYLPHISPSHLPCNAPYFPYLSPYPTAYFVPGYSPDPIRCNSDQVKSCSCGCPNHLNDHGGAQITNEKNPSDPMVVPKSYPLTQFPYHPYPVFWHPSKETEGCSILPDGGFVQNEEETGNVKEMTERNIDKQSSRPESDQQELPKCKIIPVLQLESSVDDDNSLPEKGTKNSELGNSGNGEQRTSDHNSGKQSSSQVKLPKFSPICLRVDPLPKTKDNNPSRSSSTASKKKKNQIETPEGKDLPQSLPVKRKEIFVAWDECGSGNQVDISNPIKKVNLESTGVDPNSKDKNNEEKKEEEIGELQDKHLKRLEVEAVVMIQATYRGFLVRKSEPLKKLKEFRKVREKIDGIKSRIARLEASSMDQLDEKEKVLIGETIMNSLLQRYNSDLSVTVTHLLQGLHPSVREIRKSVVKELVNLQEKLDFLTDVNSNCNVELVEKNLNNVKSDVEESTDDDKIMAEPASLESNLQELEESPALPTQNIKSFELDKLQEQNLSEIGCVLHSESTVETELPAIHEEEEECKVGEAEVLHQLQEEKLVEPACADDIKVLELVPEKSDGTDSPPSNEIEDQDEKQEHITAEAPKSLGERTLEISAANKMDDAITMVAVSTVENSPIPMEEPDNPIPMDQASAKKLEVRDQDQNLMDGTPKSLEEGTRGISAANKKDHVITGEPHNPIALDQDQNFMGETDADPPKSLEEGTHEISAENNMEDVISIVEVSTAENNSAADPIPIDQASIEEHEPTDQDQIFIGETEGNEKTNVISALNSRVKKLEKLGCKKRLKMKSLRRRSAGFRPYGLKRSTLRKNQKLYVA